MTFSDSPLLRLRKRGLSGLLAAAGCAVILAGCVATPSQKSGSTATLGFSGPVKLACDDGMEMTVTPRSGGISVVSPRGVELDLPASPPGQSVRYGESLYAVVIEGSEALWMVSGKVPITCRR